jgi:hypothetical protein
MLVKVVLIDHDGVSLADSYLRDTGKSSPVFLIQQDGVYKGKPLGGFVKGGDKADPRSTYEDGRGKRLRVEKAKEVIQWIKPRNPRRE